MWYRVRARIKGFFRRRRFRKYPIIAYYTYNEGVHGWQGWYEDGRGVVAFKRDDGAIVFDW